MGTRSITRVYQGLTDDAIAVVQMYRQFDGYPSEHGVELVDWLSGKRIVNGIAADDDRNAIANGAGCLAAQVVAYFKDGPGSIYLEAVAPNEWVDYEYHIYAAPREAIRVVVKSRSETLFDGDVQDAITWCKKE